MKTKFVPLFSSVSEKICIAVIIFLSMTIPNYVAAQLQILATNPKQGSILADAKGGIEITFDRPLNTSTLSTASVKIFGDYHGLYNHSFNFDSSSNILRILPSPAFIDGESVTAILTTALRATDGSALVRSFRLAFRTQNPFGNVLSADFEIRDIPLLPGDQQPAKIALGDFNHDDFIDAAVVNSTSNTVTNLINTTRRQRATTLSPSESYATGTTPIDIASADFDADGNLDLAIANFASNDVSIHWGLDDGSFISQPTFIEVGLRPSGIAVDDFNGDGRIDFAVSLLGEDKVIIFTNSGSGSFTRSVELNAEEGTFGVASADFDGDGDVDLAAINNGAQSVSFFRNHDFSGWQSLSPMSVPSKPITMKWGNVLNRTEDGPGDHLQELIVLSSDLTILGKTSSGSADKTQFSVFKYDAQNNSFVEAQSFSFGNRSQAFDLGSMDSELASGRFDQDHDLDLVLADYVGGSIQYLTNEDNQGWFTSFVSLDESPNPRSVVLADFDRDGDNDILYANHLQNKLRLLLTPFGNCPIYVVNFGDVLVGTTDSLDFAIRLYGSVDVNVNVEVQDEQNFDAAPRSFQLRNGQPFPLKLFFSPKDTLHYETKAMLLTDFPLEELPCFILMRGRGVDVDFNISPSVLDFKTVPPGLRGDDTLHVINKANGILMLPKLESSLPEFTHETDTIYVQPYGTHDILVTFSPQVEGSYVDTLFISSNDITKPRVSILLLGKSATGIPRITSPDSVCATEHELFYYIATAEDPDGDVIEFRFNNFPNWLRASADSLYGVPPEGAKDTTFRVIASDGFLEDTLDVYLCVIPINDPPRFADLEVQRVTEQDRLTFTVMSNDPEGELLALSARNLPQGANFVDNGNNTGTFDWTPPFRSAGTYDVTFIAKETVSNPALSDTMIGRILVGRRKPDISVSELQLSRADVRLNQDAIISARITNKNAPVLESFLVQISVDGIAIFDSTISGMEPDESFNISASAKFNRLGNITVEVEADINNSVSEIDENNNRQTLSISVTRGQLIVRPNPFTPNGDSKNDVVIFDMSQLALGNPILTILDINGRLIQTMANVHSDQLGWNGKDAKGVEQLPGVYLYILQDGAENVAKGYVVLAR